MIRRHRHNIPRGAVMLYEKVEEIKAQKGSASLWPGEYFKHVFKSRPILIGLPCGCLLVTHPSGVRLWKRFRYADKG